MANSEIIGAGQDTARPAPEDIRTMCYADPPYIGQARRHYGKHRDYAGEVDHKKLIEYLCQTYPDGWALSLSASSLKQILEMCPDSVRVMAWVKPWSSYIPSIRLQYGWEPVILSGGRQPKPEKGDKKIVDWLSASPKDCLWKKRPDGHVIGQKPMEFCYWIFKCLGLQSQDTLVDMFPGSGAVRKHWESWKKERIHALRSPAQDTMETCHTAPNSASTQIVQMELNLL